MLSSGKRARLLIVYPSLGNIFYLNLATRLSDAASELGIDAKRIGSSELHCLSQSWATSVPVLIVSPNECALSGTEALKSLKRAPFRAAVLADCVGTQWYHNTFLLDIEFDLVVDVGFLDQDSLRPFQTVPYHLLFNSPLPEEAEAISHARPGSRSITWALIGHLTSDRLALAEELSSHLGSWGFLFLPRLRPVRATEGMLSPEAVRRVLQSSNCYVWISHHSLPYYESFRFLDAVICGAVPCKIDPWDLAELGGLPNVYASVQDLSSELGERSPEELFESSKEFALSNGTLTGHLGDMLSEWLGFTR
jgi:hypothetical protein